ncbi:hypothetical protein [Paenibacillus sp. FSL H8-0332]|uniref:hypothetical protein n=1 Tax=Paenibacillus sp. FSL H8-0332 TaxID=2954742 RepID=UPI0030D3CF9C
MRKPKKLVFSFLLSLILILATGSSVFAQVSTFGPFYVRPTSAGQFDGFTVDLDSGQTTFVLKDYKVYGVHSGQKASIRWTVTDVDTGVPVLSWVEGDVTVAKDIGVTNLSPGKVYSVSWVSLNSNSVVGGTYVSVYGYAYQ